MSENNPPQLPPQPQSQPGHALPMLESEARMWAMLIHLIAAAVLFVSAGTLAFIVPLVLWLVHRQRSALVDFHGKQSLNLQLTMIVVGIAAIAVGLLTLGLGLILTVPVLIGYGIYALVISIVAGLKANAGEYYRIGFIIRFVR